MTAQGPSRRFPRLLIVGVVLFFVGAYAVVLYNRVDCGCGKQLTADHPAPDGTTVTIELDEMQTLKGTLTGNVTLTPGPSLLDPITGLKDDLAIAVHSATAPTKRMWTKGMVPGAFPVPLAVHGDPENWPLDTHRSGPVTVDLFHGSSPFPERVSVVFLDHVPGWKVDIPDIDASVPSPLYHLEMHRSPSTKAFAAVIVGVLVSLAGAAFVIAIQTARKRRQFLPPLATWYAALLFAVMPLRNALPDAPPIGSWIDVTVTLVVIVVLVVSMLIFLSSWQPEPG